MYKVISLLKRKPGTTVEAFQRYWREQHGPLAAGFPNLLRYVQSHALPQGYKKGELIFDGISEIWLDSQDSYRAALGKAQAAQILEDERKFTDMSVKVVLPVDVHVIKNGKIPDNAVKNIEFVTRRPGMNLAEFRDYWKQVHGPIASRISAVCRYEQNHLKMDEYARQERPCFEGLAITWFRSTEAMKQGTATAEYAITRADEPHFLPDGHLPIIITTERVIVG